MGYSTELFCNLSFNRETFNYKSDVESKLDDVKSYIKMDKARLRDFALMTDPEKLYNKEDYDSAYSFLTSEVENTLDDLEENLVEKFKLETLLDCWDNCHTKEGLAIPAPDSITWETSYLEGDYVKTTKSK